jgi:hypothetical protein
MKDDEIKSRLFQCNPYGCLEYNQGREISNRGTGEKQR